MSYPPRKKKQGHREPTGELRARLFLHLMDYFDEHPLRFVEERNSTSARSLARRVADWVFPLDPEG